MTQIVVCEHCSDAIDMSDDYDLPNLKCSSCGGIIKNPLHENGPTYKILSSKTRSNKKTSLVKQNSEIENEISGVKASQEADDSSEQHAFSEVNQKVSKPNKPYIPDPIIAISPQKELPLTRYKIPNMKGPISERNFIEDAIGEEGIKKVFELVSNYIESLDESERNEGRVKAIQILMKMQLTAELATHTISYAENNIELKTTLIRKHLRITCKRTVFFGTALAFTYILSIKQIPIDATGVYISASIFGISQILYLVGTRYPFFKSKKILFLVIVLSILVIIAYTANGINEAFHL